MKLVALIASVVLFSSCAAGPAAAPTVSGGCAPGIEYQGRTLDVGATWKLLGLTVGSRLEAVHAASEVLQLYLHESASLCDLHAAGKLTAVEYADRRARLAERFAGLVKVNSQVPPAQIPDAEVSLYKETLSMLRPDAPRAEASFRVRVASGGRSLESGAAMKSGEAFRIFVDVPTKAYLYVVLIDSSGAISRLYPAALTGTENPVHGKVEIPRSGEKEFVLDDVPGTERILVFVQSQRSAAIEQALAEVGTSGAVKTAAAMVLTRGVKVRETLGAAAVAKGPGDPTTTTVTGSFGQAAYEFTINHR
jgi:hypothetical protein